MRTPNETLLIFANKHKDFTNWVRKYGVRLLNTTYIHVQGEEDFKGRTKTDHYLLFLNKWEENEDNKPLKKKAERFKTVNRDRLEEILSDLPEKEF